jgi:hypothetical protein
MLSENDLKVKTGNLGEKLVAKYFRDLGHSVEESLDLLDRKKDMMIDDETCEIKTQTPWYQQKAFSVKWNQIEKCSNVDKLIFVETPSRDNPCVKIYEYKKENRNPRMMVTRDNRKMYLFPISEGNLLTTITDPMIIDQFNRYSVSTWKGHGKNSY